MTKPSRVTLPPYTKINIDNLAVVYTHNRRAWTLSGIWYEYLTRLNTIMQNEGRRIALITDNCPAHPSLDLPPKDYDGPTPSELSHVQLIYLPKRTIPFLQPLDQGIIRSFKASYRRKYAEQLVEYFELRNESPPPIDILQAIHLISAAWIELPRHIIYNFWSQASIHSQLRKSSSAYRSYKQYLEHLQSRTLIGINSLLEPDTSYHSSQVTDLVHDFLYHGEEATDPKISPDIISISDLITDMQQHGII